jgi:hypothetical protein
MVFIKTARKVPKIPGFTPPFKSYEEDIEEFNVSQQATESAISH